MEAKYLSQNSRTVSAQISARNFYRTVSAQPHNPAHVFLLLIAHRCNIMLEIRGDSPYFGEQMSVTKGNNEQQ
jgi:hypothetical protein